MAWQNIQVYNDRFAKKSVQFKAGPVQTRSCTQWGCLFLFALIFIATFGGGAYFIYSGKDSIAQMISQTQSNKSTTGFGYIMAKMATPIVGMLILSSALSVGIVLLSRFFPKPTMYFMIAFTFLAYIAIIIAGFVLGSIALSIIFIIVLVINAIVLYCFRQYIEIGLKLMQCAVRFIIQKPAVYFISIMCLILNVAYTVFWVFSWLGVYSSGVIQDSTTYRVLTYVWYADAVFWGFYLQFCVEGYCQFEVSFRIDLFWSDCYYGYYGFEGIGAIAEELEWGDAPPSLHNPMHPINDLRYNEIMSVTGQGYIASAKSAVSLIFDNLPLFIIVDYFTDFYQFFSKFFITLVPAIIGGIIIYQKEQAQNGSGIGTTNNAMTYAIWGAIIIALLAMVISSVIVGMINQAMSCIYIFYCFDQKFRSMGIQANNIPKQIQEIFGRASNNQTAHQASMNYINRRRGMDD